MKGKSINKTKRNRAAEREQEGRQTDGFMMAVTSSVVAIGRQSRFVGRESSETTGYVYQMIRGPLTLFISTIRDIQRGNRRPFPPHNNHA